MNWLATKKTIDLYEVTQILNNKAFNPLQDREVSKMLEKIVVKGQKKNYFGGEFSYGEGQFFQRGQRIFGENEKHG